MTIKRTAKNVVNQLISSVDAKVIRASEHRTATAFPLDGDQRLERVRELLDRTLDMIFLGSIGDSFQIPGNLEDKVRIFSLDAVDPGEGGDSGHQVVPIAKVVGPKEGPITFIERENVAVSSALLPKQDLIAAYGIEDYYRKAKEHHVDAVTLEQLADEHGVKDFGFIKTDLEGLDFDVLKGFGERVRDTGLIQMELRFEPFYEGEPYFHEVAAYLAERGFEVLDLKPERWRANTPHRDRSTRGRIVFVNALFVNRDLEHRAPVDRVRQVIILGLMGYSNFAERLLAGLQADEPAAAAELSQLLFGKAGEPYLPMPDAPHVTHGSDDGYG